MTDPAAIDLNKVREAGSAAHLAPLCAAVEALRERVAGQENTNIDVYEKSQLVTATARSLAAELERRTAEAHAVELAVALKDAVSECPKCDGEGEVITERTVAEVLSRSVEPCSLCKPWRTALSTLPPQALERAKAKDEVVGQACEVYTRLLILTTVGKLKFPDQAAVHEFKLLGVAIANLDALDQEDT